MRRLVPAAVAALLLVAANPVAAALAVGDDVPELSVPAAEGGKITTVELSELLEKGPVVIYFFPSAFSDTAASRDFAANIDKFRAAGVSVVGVSRDTIDSLADFSVEVAGGKFPVASASESVVNAFEVNDGAMFNTRTTYVVAPSGKIAFVHDDQDYGNHVKSALAFVQAMEK